MPDRDRNPSHHDGEYLQAKGYSADLYPDGDAGYKAFAKGKYDLVVLDVMMPKKDGTPWW